MRASGSGAYSRSGSNPKHSFHVYFRNEYGAGKLEYPLFGGAGVDRFDKFDLKTSQNYSWAYEGSTQNTFIRDVFSRDVQRDMGRPHARSRFYHLYINGQYWGLYQTQERGDADYAATYEGGNAADWDCIKTSQPGYVTTASDGNFDAFYGLDDIAIKQGFAGAFANNYYLVKGLNPDGSPNPAYPVYLDEDNLMVYMLIACYTGDPNSLTAEYEDRVKFMVQRYHLSEGEAKKIIKEKETQRAAVATNIFGADIDDPKLYHIVLNTSLIPFDRAVEAAGDLFFRFRKDLGEE